jgi:hypothetical protein
VTIEFFCIEHIIGAAEYSVALFISKKVDAPQEIIVGILCGNYVGFNTITNSFT